MAFGTKATAQGGLSAGRHTTKIPPQGLSPKTPERSGLSVAISPSPARYQANPLLTQARRPDRGEGASSAPFAPAPPIPSAPGAGSLFGAAASGGVFFGLFAVFLAFLMLATPGMRRWLRSSRELIRPPALDFLLERPG